MSKPSVNVNPKKSFIDRKFKYLIGFMLLIIFGLAGFYWKKTSSKPAEEYSQWSKPTRANCTSTTTRFTG